MSIWGTSPHHTTSGATAVNVRRIRSRATGRLPCRVSDRRRLAGLRARPSSTVRAATVFSDTVQPASRRSRVILGVAVGAARGREQTPDLLLQPLPPLITAGRFAVDLLVVPGLRDLQCPAGDRVRNAETGPLGRDELRHDHWFIVSFTYRATARLRTSRSISNFALSLAHRACSARNRQYSDSISSLRLRPRLPINTPYLIMECCDET